MIKEMDGFKWDITNTVIDELIPLPPCLGNNFLGEFDSISEQYPNIHEEFAFDESLSHAILAFHELESINRSLRIDGVTSSSTDCMDDDNIDSKCFSKHQESKLEMRNENAFSQLYQTSMNNLNLKQSHTLFDHNRNPNFRKGTGDDAKCPKATFVACDSSHKPKRFEIVFDNTYQSKKKKLHSSVSSTTISFDNKSSSSWELDEEAIAEVKEMVYMKAALRPISLEVEEPVEKPKRKNVRVSSDPQTVAARHRREKISERLRVLQRLVPGGSKLDTASMLDEAASYVKFLQSLVRGLENMDPTISTMISVIANPVDTRLSLPQMKP